MKSKRGVELSLSTIVVAAIALIVLVVVVAIFTGALRKVPISVNSCEAKGGDCPGEGRLCEAGAVPLQGFSCESKKGPCCIPTYDEASDASD